MKAKAYRLEGPARAHAKDRLDLPIDEAAEAVCIALGPAEASLAAVARALPDPTALPARALVVIPGTVFESPSFGARLRWLFGRGPEVARSDRCGALLARGYTDIGASTDPDLAWGLATGPC